ncbi:hypothetical protein ACH4MU_29865 [Streptomyces albidoflavus]
MSDAATDLVWSRSKAARGAFIVLLALAREADDEGNASLTLENLSVLTRLTPRSISKCLGELESIVEVRHQRGGGSSNPNSYSILLDSEERSSFQEVSSHNPSIEVENTSHSPQKSEVPPSRTRGGNTPYGSITTKKEASLLNRVENANNQQDGIEVPEGAKELVAAITEAGLIVGWRLTKSEWDSVTALSDRWGTERLVEMIARRWNSDHPPKTARYLLRIWADLPDHAPKGALQDNVVPLRRQPGKWTPFQNTANASAYQNGF